MQSFGRALARGAKSGRQAVMLLGQHILLITFDIGTMLITAHSVVGPSATSGPSFRQGGQVWR